MPTAKDLIDDLLHPFRAAMAEARITPQLLAKKLTAELKAKETKYFQHQGKVISRRVVVVWGIRQAARIDAQKLLGAYPSEKIEFPDKHGKPQQIGGVISDPERAARLIYLIQQAQKRDKEAKRKKK